MAQPLYSINSVSFSFHLLVLLVDKIWEKMRFLINKLSKPTKK